MLKFATVVLGLMVAFGAQAQSVTNRVTGAVGSATGTVSAGASVAGGTVAGNPFSALNDTGSGGSNVGGGLPGGYRTKIGGQPVEFRGAVGVGSDSTNVRAGAGIPF